MAMSPRDQREWDQFVARVRADSIAKIAQSALTMCITPASDAEDVDVRQAVEIGASLLLNKPVVIVAPSGRSVPDALRRAATHVIELEHDLDLDVGMRELQSKLQPVLVELGIGS